MDTLAPFFNAIGSGQFRVITSLITLSEVLVIPLRTSNNALTDRYRAILSPDAGVTAHKVTREIAEEAARIRAAHGRIRTPDAIQMATATVGGASYFLTNDTALPNLPNLQMLVVDNLAQE